MIVNVDRTEYPKLAKYLEFDFPNLAYDHPYARAFEKFTAWHPTEQLSGFGQVAFRALLSAGCDPMVTVSPPKQPSIPGITTGIKVARRYADPFEVADCIDPRFTKVTGLLAGRTELYHVTGQVLAQLVRWAIWKRDAGKPPQWAWTTETPAQLFLDYLYGPNVVNWG